MNAPWHTDLDTRQRAYRDGLRNGHLDRLFGHLSIYALTCLNDQNAYAANYAAGYYDGLRRTPLI